jgi:hypothetical protein
MYKKKKKALSLITSRQNSHIIMPYYRATDGQASHAARQLNGQIIWRYLIVDRRKFIETNKTKRRHLTLGGIATNSNFIS